jgi:hypothetical protein
MSEISVVVVGSTSINSTVGNGDSVVVSVNDQAGGGNGKAATIEVGSTTTLAATQSASVVNVGTAYAAKFNFGIPRGPTGPATSLSVGTVSTGTSVAVSISGSAGSQAISFVFPAAVTLSTATPSALGVAAAGTSTSASRSDHVHLLPTISYTALTNVPTSFTPASHTQAASTISDFATQAAKYGPVTSVNGLTGAVSITTGSTSSITLSDASPSPLGTASAGTSTSASRSDHVHLLPTISYTALTNVPTSFTPASHTQAASTISDFATEVAKIGNVISVNGLTGAVTITTGAALSSATPQPLGTASAGTSTSASRSDHVHLLPTISYTSLINVPTSFTPAAHTQAASTISDFATEAAKYGPITTVAGRTGAVTISTADVSGFATEVAKIGNVISVNGLTGAVTITTGATSGITLSDASPSPLGTASAGTGTSASRSDHVHLLSIATTSAAGAIIVGAGLAVSSGVLSATGGTGTSSYTLPNATTTALGGVVVGSGLSVASGTISANVTSVQGRTGAVTVAATDLTAVTTVTTGITGATAVTNLMALSASAYSAITSKHTATLYIISG